MQLTENFNLLELTSSETATRKGIDNTPGPAEIHNLRYLLNEVMQPLRSWYGKPINITSGYRSPKLNKAIGGSTTSDHCRGQAIDFTVPKEDYKKVFDYIKTKLVFDQCILEFATNGYPIWIHVSYRVNNNRKQILIATKNAFGQTKYIAYTKESFEKIYFNLV